MVVMACDENIVDGHGSGLPFVTESAEAGHDLLVVGALTRLRWNQMRYRFAMTGNRNGLATFDRPEELCEACLRFGYSYRAHGGVQPVKITRSNLKRITQGMQPVWSPILDMWRTGNGNPMWVCRVEAGTALHTAA